MKNNKGFTLVELLAVIVLIAVLTVVAVSTYRGINESSKQKTLDAKIQQITSAAEKWARENNITSKTTLSVNTLVVEGYITADEAGTDGLAVIKNPVTEENMICNVVDITFKDGVVQAKFNGSVQNCKLASQSLIDRNINIKVISASGKDLTGTGNIAKWTNEDVIVIVNSDEYDSKVSTIYYDFEGSTITRNKDTLSKYTGSTFISKNEAKNYYNVFYIESELLLNSRVVVTYDIPGEGTKSRYYTVRFDKEEATAALKSNNEWITTSSEVQVIVDDGKGSGPAAIYMSRDTNRNHATRTTATPKANVTGLEIGKYYVWTEDQAGNISHTYKMILEINNQDDSTPECAVSFEGHKGQGHWYKEVPVTPHAENTVPAGISGNNIGVNDDADNPTYNAYAAYNTTVNTTGLPRTTDTTRAGVPYYCHVKTLAGIYSQATQTLWLDMTPPTLTTDITSDENYTRTKAVYLTVADNLSGLDKRTFIRYGWALAGEQPSWSTIEDVLPDSMTGVPHSITLLLGGSDLTGIYYLWIDYSAVTDYAGNHAASINGQGSGGTAVFGPFMFDNTPPVCGVNNGKTNWTKGTYTINQYCRDDDGTPDQSGCAQAFYTIPYTIFDTVKSDSVIIYDNVGLHTECHYDVYLDNTSPDCDGVGGKTNWTKGTYTVSQKCSEDAVNQSGCALPAFTQDYSATQTVKTDTITIFDNVGNTRVCPTNIYLDNTPPTCDGVGGKTNWTKGTYTVSQDCSEDAVNQSGCSQAAFTKSYTTAQTVKTDTIVISDNVNNTTVCPTNIYLDNTSPVCDGVGGKTSWTNGIYLLTQKCSESAVTQSGCESATFTKAYGNTDNYKTDTIVIRDNVGNETTCPTNVYLEHTKPSCKLEITNPSGGPDGSNGWYKSGSVTVTATFKDNGSVQSGVDQYGAAKTPNSINESTTVKFTENGSSLTAYCYVNDEASNQNSNSLTFKKDDATEALNGGCSWTGQNSSWTNSPWTYSVYLNTVPISKCSLDAADQEEITENCINNVTIDPEVSIDSKSWTVRFESNSGITIPCSVNNFNFYFDGREPVCGTTTGESTTWQKANRTVTVGCSEDAYGAVPSGCTKTTFSKTFNTTTQVGQVTIKDTAGNETACDVNVYVDKTQPTCGTVTGGSTTWTTGNRTISVGCSDAHSGCAKNSYSDTFTTTGKTGTITIKDKVGNTRDCTVNKYIDKSSPDATCTKSHTGYTSGVTCTVTCSDTGSGCVSSGDDQGAHTGLKKKHTYTVKDRMGHTDSCSCSVSTSNCNCTWYCDGTCSGTNCTACNKRTTKTTCESNSGCSWKSKDCSTCYS